MSEARKAEMKGLYEDAYIKAQEFVQKLGPTGELFRKNEELSAPIFDKINVGFDFGYGFDREKVDGVPSGWITHFQFGPQIF